MRRKCSLPVRRSRSLSGSVLPPPRSVLIAILAALAGGCAVAHPIRVDRIVNNGWRFLRADVAGAQAPCAAVVLRAGEGGGGYPGEASRFSYEILGLVGREGVRRFYTDHFVGHNPPDTKIVPISRTVGTDRVVDELIFCFTHTQPIDWMLPDAPGPPRERGRPRRTFGIRVHRPTQLAARTQRAQRRLLNAPGQPCYELPLIKDGIDLAALYRLAEALREQGAA